MTDVNRDATAVRGGRVLVFRNPPDGDRRKIGKVYPKRVADQSRAGIIEGLGQRSTAVFAARLESLRGFERHDCRWKNPAFYC